jgi:hypothetical protein
MKKRRGHNRPCDRVGDPFGVDSRVKLLSIRNREAARSSLDDSMIPLSAGQFTLF